MKHINRINRIYYIHFSERVTHTHGAHGRLEKAHKTHDEYRMHRSSGSSATSKYIMDGMERYQWEAGYITRHNRVRLRYDANPTMANVASLRGRLREASVHRRYPPKVRAKIFYDDL